MPGKFDLFWTTMELCDWRDERNADKVLRPVIRYLSKQDDQIIFAFDDLMTELLYDLDTKKLAEQCEKVDPLMCDDTFFYEKVKRGRMKKVWSMDFEALLYVPGKAWALKHRRSADGYPHVSPLSYETGSNAEGWNK